MILSDRGLTKRLAPIPSLLATAGVHHYLIRNGLLEGGTKIPSVRELANTLGLSVKTVRTAYDELAAQTFEDRPDELDKAS